jgi:putative ABC transport system ATP-binding protein
MAEPFVEAEALSRIFDRGGRLVMALQDVSLCIEAGDRIALLGPSGSGKTTLLNMIAGLDRPSAGRIEWPALGPAGQLRPVQVGVMFQSRSLIPALTCLENVELPLRLAGREDDLQATAMVALSRFQVEHIAEMLPEEISGGQEQRVALARAVVAAPRLVLADEPTGQLDRHTAEVTVESLLGWADETRALVVATHDLKVANRMTQIWELVHGDLVHGRRSSAA